MHDSGITKFIEIEIAGNVLNREHSFDREIESWRGPAWKGEAYRWYVVQSLGWGEVHVWDKKMDEKGVFTKAIRGEIQRPSRNRDPT